VKIVDVAFVPWDPWFDCATHSMPGTPLPVRTRDGGGCNSGYWAP
jgi:hypothetical protein